MKISLNGLKEFLYTDLSPEKIAEILTDIGLEVEGIEHFESIRGSLKGIIVGEVISVTQHPNADKLKITQVNLGAETKQIVCGASNVAVGQKVPVATIGTEIFLQNGESFIIKIGKLRGEESHGMICAEDEIGLGNSHDGIMILSENAIVGQPLNEIFPVEQDYVFEIGLTPNRADAMSHYGVARDLFAALQQRNIKSSFNKLYIDDNQWNNNESSFQIIIENKEFAPRYAIAFIENINIKESPNWLKNRLKALGLSPINNVVDATNYMLHTFGQPLHAFDAAKISQKTLRVGKPTAQNQTFVSLDNAERKLNADDLLIKDGDNVAMCFAGVFGGIDSGVNQNTKNIVLESAYFNPILVRKTAKNHGLNTDASFRFERGIDPNVTLTLLKKAAFLIAELSDGKIAENFVEFYPEKIEDFKVTLRYETITKILGHRIETNIVKNILQSLDIEIVTETETSLQLSVPFYRNDVKREIDVIEEILRIYGYNSIEIPEKISFSYQKSAPNISYENEKVIGNLLTSNGFFEVLNNSLVSDELQTEKSVKLLNPLSSDLAVMREEMFPAMLENIAYNNNRKQQNLKFFEFGNVYQKNTEYIENKKLAITISGNYFEINWMQTENKSTFFHLKGIVNLILNALGITIYDENPLETEEGIVLKSAKKDIATLKKIDKRILKNYDISQEVFYAELHWNACMELVKKSAFKLKEIPKFLSVKRDLALLLDKTILYNDLHNAAFSLQNRLLKKVHLFDVYEGKNLPEGKKSYALSFEIHDENKTLTDKEIDAFMQKLIKLYSEKFGATLR